MKNVYLFLAAISVMVLCACSQEESEEVVLREYPTSVTVEHVDTYHGTDVADPYRWLENDVRVDDQVSAWVDAQNEVAFAYLNSIPERELIENRLLELWDYERYSLPLKAGDRYFYSYNNGLQIQNVVYTQRGLEAEATVLVDPNVWSDDGTVALADYTASPDGNYVAYLIQDGGSDWREARVINVATTEVLEDHLEWLKFTAISWAGDSSGFYYSRYPETSSAEKFQSLNQNQTVYFHRLGTPQSDDPVVYARPDHPDWGLYAEVTDDGSHLVVTISVGTDSRFAIVYQDLTDTDAVPEMIIDGFDNDYALIGNMAKDLYFRTDNGAPKNRVIVINTEDPRPENWHEVIPESQDVLDGVSLIGGRLIAEYMQDAWSIVQIFDLDGKKVGRVDLPGIGTAEGFNGSADNPETFFSYSSFNTPPVISRLDVSSGEVSVFRQSEVAFNPDD